MFSYDFKHKILNNISIFFFLNSVFFIIVFNGIQLNIYLIQFHIIYI